MASKMTDEPENLVLLMLREIRAKQDEHSSRLDHIDTRLASLDKQLDDYKKIVRYTLGTSSETELRQVQQESRINEIFEKLERLLSERAPS